LPKINDFECFKFTLCVSNEKVGRDYINQHSAEFKKEVYTFEDISKILQALNKYLKNCWIETDWDINYLHELLDHWISKTKAWECLNYLTDFHDDFWVKNKNPNPLWQGQGFIWCSKEKFGFNFIGNASNRLLIHKK
jgi:hypothetical protein